MSSLGNRLPPHLSQRSFVVIGCPPCQGCPEIIAAAGGAGTWGRPYQSRGSPRSLTGLGEERIGPLGISADLNIAQKYQEGVPHSVGLIAHPDRGNPC